MGVPIWRMFACGLPLLFLSACSHFDQLSAGPAANIVDGRGSFGGAVLGERVVGSSSPSGGFFGVSAGGRASATQHVLDVAPFVGSLVGTSVDRTFLYGTMRIGPGFQLFEGRPLGFGAVGGSLGLGYAVSDTGWRYHRPWKYPFGYGAPPFGAGGPDVVSIHQGEDAERSRVLLTFGLATDMDVRFTRSPLVTFGFLVGIAWMDEDVPPR